MRVRVTALALVIAAVSASAVSAQNAKKIESKLMVQVGVFTLKPDGTPGGFAIQNGEAAGDSLAGATVVLNGCGVGAGSNWLGNKMPEHVWDAWETKGRVVSLSGTHAVVQVEWQRVRTAGAVSSSPAQTQTLTLGLDQLQILDRTSPPVANCSPDFAPVFGARFAWSPPIGAVVNGVRVSGPGPAGAQPFSAELWLVRHVPGQPDDVKATTVRLTDTGAFDFGRQQFSTGGGVLDVRVEGRLRIVGGQKTLQFDATRAAAFTPTSQPPRDRVAPQPEGRASVSRLLPGPDEVIEFEMPPLELSRAPKLPDSFAIRLRIRAAK